MTRLSAVLVLAGCPGGSAGTEDTAAVECDTAVVRYVDADGDGYGATPAVGCEAGVEGGGDCDDTNVAVHPFAGDHCGDGVDQDCTGADRTCGDYGVGDASVMVDLAGECSLVWRAIASHGEPERTSSVVLQCGFDYLGAIPLVEGAVAAAEAVEARFVQTDGVGTYRVWGSFDVRTTDAGGQLFASYAGGPLSEGVRRYDPVWSGDRSDSSPDALWGCAGRVGVQVAPESAGDGGDRILVYTEEAGSGSSVFVDPDAASGELPAVASSSVAGGPLYPAGDLDGDGIPDLTWYDYATDDYIGLVYGPIHDGDHALADLVDRAWATWVQPSPVGDVNGDGLGDLAVSIETEADHDNLVERRVYLLAGTAPSGAVEDAAWLTVASDECGEIRVNEDATTWGCDVWLAPVQAGDLDGDGTAELVLHGVYASGETDDSQAAVIFDVSSGTLELGAATPGVVWLDAGMQSHWQGGSPVQRPPEGGFSTDFDADGVLDLFLFSAADENSGAAATSFLYGFRGPIE